MTPHELQTHVSRQIETATGTLNSDIATHRAEMLERYQGEPYGDEVKDRSQVVMSDVSDTVEWIMPELMDIFTGGDDAVEFEPQGQEDEGAAKQETSVVNHIFSEKNDGFLIFYQWFKDALIQKNGIVKSYWDESVREEIETYEDLTFDEFQQIMAQMAEDAEEIDLLEQSWEEGEEPVEPIRVKIRVKSTQKQYKVQNIPPEEFLVTPRWNSVFLDGCPFQAHKAKKTVSDLIEMGFDPKQVYALPDDHEDLDEEEVQRFNAKDNTEYGEAEEPDDSMREVTLYECYIRVDYDDDDSAELLQVYVGGEQNEILRWADGSEAIEEVSHAPFDAITPIIMTHKFFGRSVAETVADLQRIRTVLVRQMLDNIYIGNNARPHVDETIANDHTLDDLLNQQVGYPIRGDGPMAGVSYAPVPNVTTNILQAVEYVDGLRENRSGVTKYNQGLDADSLNKTATGIRSIISASQKKILLIARIFAETGVKSLFRRIHRDLRKGPLKSIALRVRNEWVDVNPRVWRERADMSVSVGLGTGDKDQMLMRLDAILERQIQALQAGLAGPEQILHTLHKMVEAAGFKSPEMFFSLQQAPEQADPTEGVLAVQREQIIADMEKVRIDAMNKDADRRLKRDEILLKDDRERDMTAAKLTVEIEKARQAGEESISVQDLLGMLAPPGGMQ